MIRQVLGLRRAAPAAAAGPGVGAFEVARGPGGAFVVEALPCLADNYQYLVHHGPSRSACFVDAVDAPALLARARELDVELDRLSVLSTHHQADHTGGNLALAAAVPGLRVLCGEAAFPKVPGATEGYGGDGVALVCEGNVRFRALATPGHTLGCTTFVLEAVDGAPVEPPVAFTGDCLFAGGCGRVLEGDAAQMHASLKALGRLPGETLVCCGHEYTCGNLKFAASVLKDPAIAARLAACEARRAEGLATVPSSIAVELDTNIFLRTEEPAVQAAAGRPGDPLGAFTSLRRGKDTFTRVGAVITLGLDLGRLVGWRP